MFCKKCGQEIEGGVQFCPNCGNPSSESQELTLKKEEKLRCLPSFILGLIGSLFGMFGGICTTMCSFGSSSNNAFFLIVGGSLIGLIGACLCLNKAKLGSILETAGALMIIYRAYFKGGSDFMTVIALVLLLLGGIVGLVYAFLIKRK